MSFQQVLEAVDLLSPPDVSGATVAQALRRHGIDDVSVVHATGVTATTDFVSCRIPGTRPGAPAIGIIGRLGGLGARPDRQGLVSDADGGIVALATAFAIADLAAGGERFRADVRVHTHICPAATTRPHAPVPMMRSPLPAAEMMRHEVHPDMAAVLSVDTSRGNRFVNQRAVAITPVVKEGWLLPVTADVLDLVGWVTGSPPVVLPLATQDVTPQENGLWHVNSILQPATATSAPVLGVALTSETVVPGSATGVTDVPLLDAATRLCVEIAKAFTSGQLALHEQDVYRELLRRYGSMAHLQQIDPLAEQ